MNKLTLFLILLCLPAQALVLKPTKGSLQFNASATPTFLQIDGEGALPSGQAQIDKDGKLSAEFELKLDSLDSKNSTRNRHMKEKYLQIDKFPSAKLKIVDLDLGKEWKLEK